MFTTIVACDMFNGIAKKDEIPWYIPEELAHFKQTTLSQVVIMGSKTYVSIIKKTRNKVGLPNRFNIVLTRDSKYLENNMSIDNEYERIIFINNLWDCVKYCVKTYPDKKYFVIGGAEIYDLFINNGLIGEEIITTINNVYDCDKFYHCLSHKKDSCSLVKDINVYQEFSDLRLFKISYFKIKPKNQEEKLFLSVMHDILTNGIKSDDRTGTGTLSLFGQQLRFSLSHNTFPLLTTRKMYFKGIFEELMMFIRGQTDSKVLEKKNINIWKGNTSREFLDNRGLNHLPVGDMGHTYGFSFRHFGADYIDCTSDYHNKGFDQITWLINEIKTNPSSRRLIISLWEPNKIHMATLPPCLYQYQFYVRNGMLSCMATQRSSDYFTAGGWNIATASLLTILLASVCGLTPHELIWNIADIHIYNNLVDQANEQIKRTPKPFPKLILHNPPKNIEEFEMDNIVLIGYDPYPVIQGVFNV